MQHDTVHPTPNAAARQRTKTTPWRCPRDGTCASRDSHDNLPGYKEGCRSGAARHAKAREMASYRARRAQGATEQLNSIGAARRLRSLHAIGRTYVEMGAALGVTKSRIEQLIRAKNPLITQDLHARIHELWIEWGEVDLPETWRRKRTRDHAARLGWHPPEAWHPDRIDKPKAKAYHNGIDARLVEAADRREEVRRRTLAGESARKIAEALHTSDRVVQRHRTALVDAGELPAPAASGLTPADVDRILRDAS